MRVDNLCAGLLVQIGDSGGWIAAIVKRISFNSFTPIEWSRLPYYYVMAGFTRLEKFWEISAMAH